MVSRVMLAVSALSMARRRRGLLAGSGSPRRAAVVISRMRRVNSLPRFASCAFLRCCMLAHLLCPAMVQTPFLSKRKVQTQHERGVQRDILGTVERRGHMAVADVQIGVAQHLIAGAHPDQHEM